MILHAGDVGSHGGELCKLCPSISSAVAATCLRCISVDHGGLAGILTRLEAIAPTLAVRGNVDDIACELVLPRLRLIELCGWRLLLQHIVDCPAKVRRY